MEFYEDKNIEYKGFDKLFGKKAVLSDIAKECVAFANAQGGWIVGGIEDGETEPPQDQKIDMGEMNQVVSRLRSLTDSVGFVNPEIIAHENGGYFFKFRILPTSRTIATTTSGKVFIRITDKCMPVTGEDLTNLAAEKNAFQWELVPTKTPLYNAEEKAKAEFLKDIRNSPKVSNFIKSKDDNEVLSYYQLITEDSHHTAVRQIAIDITRQDENLGGKFAGERNNYRAWGKERYRVFIKPKTLCIRQIGHYPFPKND